MSATHPRRCAAQHCRHAAALRSRLCAGCRDRFAAHLTDLPARYAALDHGRPPGTPMPPHVVEARTAIRGVLAAWAHLVVTGRAAPRPVRSVAGMVEFLHRHVDWLGAHPAAGEITAEVAELATRFGAPPAEPPATGDAAELAARLGTRPPAAELAARRGTQPRTGEDAAELAARLGSRSVAGENAGPHLGELAA